MKCNDFHILKDLDCYFNTRLLIYCVFIVLESLIDDAVRNGESAARHRDMMAAVTRELMERADERNTRVAVQKCKYMNGF